MVKFCRPRVYTRIPCKGFLQKGHPHFIGVGVRVGGVNLVSVDDWQIVVNEDVIPDTKAPEPAVEDAVILRGSHGVGVPGDYLKVNKTPFAPLACNLSTVWLIIRMSTRTIFFAKFCLKNPSSLLIVF